MLCLFVNKGMISYVITMPFNFSYEAPNYGLCYIICLKCFLHINEVIMFISCDVKFSNNMCFFYTQILVNVDTYITILRIVLVDQ